MNNKTDDASSAENFVTVVSVGNKTSNDPSTNEKEFVTVLRIGEDDQECDFVTEEVLVYRLPGERLGFGLKFEGGTKATEYVKKLFIQSCAPDSPASKVSGSWGHLTEGDEVLVIDSRPVTTMTRMDCVKCLKDSSVVIKLLVRHQKSKSVEALPLVISAEKKRPPALPPTPPPVPPRKIPKKQFRSARNVETAVEAKPRLKNIDATSNVSTEARNSKKLAESFSNPPDAEYYVDLFSQDSIHSLSESDDTASTISTIVDRNGNSLPSTPKSIQKHLDISNFPDDDIFNITSDTKLHQKLEFTTIPDDNTDTEDTNQPDSLKSVENIQRDFVFQTHDENMNIFNLPRLVDFVPKSFSDMDHKKIMNLFLSSERGEHLDFKFNVPDDVTKVAPFNEDMDMFPKWSISPQLATIGEVEEECLSNENFSNRFSDPMPTLVIECEEENERKNEDDEAKLENQIMEPPPSDRRQPPDGHEFPDFEENFSNRTNDRLKSRSVISPDFDTIDKTPENQFSTDQPDTSTLNKLTSLSNMDLSTRENDDGNLNFDVNENKKENSILTLYSRSQSLCDLSNRRSEDPLRNLVEQRRKNLSKLKGLVIPDAISESDFSSTINLPEIKSTTTTLIEEFKPVDTSIYKSIPDVTSAKNTVLPPITPPWAATVNFPKYSPAFKQKDLKLHSRHIEESKIHFSDEFLNTRKKSMDGSTSKSENSSDYVFRDKPKRTNLTSTFRRREINTDEESDNDSAVSSSQSSLASRPMESPSSVENYAKTDYSPTEFKHIKSSSVEALNRKNILASAKCRSGKDFKIGSPVVNRKVEVETEKTENVEKPTIVEKKEQVQVIEEKNLIKASTKVEKLVPEETQKDSVAQKIPNQTPKKSTASPRTNLWISELKPTTRSTSTTSTNREKNSMFLNLLKPVPTVSRIEERVSKFSSRKSLSVTDLRKNFEEIAKNVSAAPTFGSKNLDSLPKTPKIVPTTGESPKITNKKMPSMGSGTPSEMKENRGKSRKVILKPNTFGESPGITIAGGIDENMDITVHRIRYGSVAYQNGTLIRGDHILSINGKPTAGLSYSEAVQLLKVPSETYVIEIALKEEAAKDMRILKRRSISLDSTLDSGSPTVDKVSPSRKPNHEIILLKDQNGLGFSVEGGRDSPQGDVPITVKKIFQGGVAEKDGRLKVGDQILAINEIDFTNLSRIQAWTVMKKVDLGKTKIMIYR